jgi:hypothetical protein
MVGGVVGDLKSNAVTVDGGTRAYYGARGHGTAIETDNASQTTFHLLP